MKNEAIFLVNDAQYLKINVTLLLRSDVNITLGNGIEKTLTYAREENSVMEESEFDAFPQSIGTL